MKPKKQKKIKAWAVLNKYGELISWQPCHTKEKACGVFQTKRDAWLARTFTSDKIIPCLITLLPAKK